MKHYSVGIIEKVMEHTGCIKDKAIKKEEEEIQELE